MSIVFSAPIEGIIVSQNLDGTYSWSGCYHGLPIVDVLPAKDSTQCIILLDREARNSSVFENLLCIDEHGAPIWIAELPTRTDVFVSIREDGDALKANTWDGMLVLLDKQTGKKIQQKFVK